MKQFKYVALAIVFFSVLSISAQQKFNKVSKTLKVNKDVTLNLDTNHTNIEIDTWNKNEIRLEAFVESDELSKEDLKEVLDSWNVDIDGTMTNVSINSDGGYRGNWNFEYDFAGLDVLKDIEIEIPEIPEMPKVPNMPEMPELNFEMPEVPEIPELPELPDGVHDVNFNVDKYKKEGEPYLEKWSQEFEDKYGKGYKEKIKKWAKQFSKINWDAYSAKMEKWGEEFGEKFGEEYGKEMEEWGKEFSMKFDEKWAKEMEEWGEKFGEKFGKEWEEKGKIIEERMKEFEEQWDVKAEEFEEQFEALERKRSKVKKTIRIKMPKDTKLKVNVRHGELKFASVIHNLKADLSHSSLLADHIDGSETSINASYSPLLVGNWDAGELKIKYIEDALLKKVNTLVLYSNSSNITIDYLAGNSIIDGSFGNLTINNILDSFNNLNVVLENSDAHIKLPKTDYKLQYKGSRSRLNHPDSESKENVSSFSTGELDSARTIVLNAKYSNIYMQ